MKEWIKKILPAWCGQIWQQRRWIILATLFFTNAFVWHVVYREDRHGILTVAFLDVGQGDSIYIEAPNGNQIVLDGGPNKKVLQSLGAVMPFYDRSIDLLALSHPHLDHFAGFLDIIPRYSAGGIITSGTVADTPEYKLWQKAEARSGAKIITARRGTVIDMGGGVTLDVLLPSQDVTNATPHGGMMVLQLHYGKTAVLLTGDMEKNLEDYLISLNGDKLKSDVLKVGHHGSKTSSSEELLGNAAPKYAVISVGLKNMYGHPNKEILDRLEKFGVQVFRTDQGGTVVLKSDGEALTLKSI